MSQQTIRISELPSPSVVAGSDILYIAAKEGNTFFHDRSITFDRLKFEILRISGSTAQTASYVKGENVDGPVDSALTANTSITSDTASYVSGSNVDGAVDLAITASYALNAGVSIDTSSLIQSSQTSSMTVLSASHAITASFALNAGTSDTTDTLPTGSNVGEGEVLYIGDGSITSSKAVTIDTAGDVDIQNNLTIAGTITSNEFIVTFVSSSVLYDSGSTKFGDTLDDTHQFTGSVSITGSSLSINGNEVLTTADISSLTVDSASYAATASNVEWSNVNNAPDFVLESETSSMSVLSASHAITASYVDYNNVDNVPDFVLESETSSMSVLSASYALTASYVTNAGNVYISQSVQNADLGSVTVTDFNYTSSFIPTSPTSSGNKGDIAYDENYLYQCVEINTWKRSVIASW
jgi:hypothetical protein